jgi:hypothetical protein
MSDYEVFGGVWGNHSSGHLSAGILALGLTSPLAADFRVAARLPTTGVGIPKHSEQVRGGFHSPGLRKDLSESHRGDLPNLWNVSAENPR